MPAHDLPKDRDVLRSLFANVQSVILHCEPAARRLQHQAREIRRVLDQPGHALDRSDVGQQIGRSLEELLPEPPPVFSLVGDYVGQEIAEAYGSVTAALCRMRESCEQALPVDEQAQALEDLVVSLDGVLEPAQELRGQIIDALDELAALEYEAAQDVVGDAPARHSEDFRSVHWFGEYHCFTPIQAACVKALWQAWTNQTPEVGQDTVLEAADSMNRQLSGVFRNHVAWKTMIVAGSTRGTFRLQAPELIAEESGEL